MVSAAVNPHPGLGHTRGWPGEKDRLLIMSLSRDASSRRAGSEPKGEEHTGQASWDAQWKFCQKVLMCNSLSLRTSFWGRLMLKPLAFIAGNTNPLMLKPLAFITANTNPWAISGHVSILSLAFEEVFPSFTLGFFLHCLDLLVAVPSVCPHLLESFPHLLESFPHLLESHPGTQRRLPGPPEKESSSNTIPHFPPWLIWAGATGNGVLYLLH